MLLKIFISFCLATNLNSKELGSKELRDYLLKVQERALAHRLRYLVPKLELSVRTDSQSNFFFLLMLKWPFGYETRKLDTRLGGLYEWD